MKTLVMRHLFLAIAGFVLIGWASSATAACLRGDGPRQVLGFSPPASVSVPRDAPIGTIFATAPAVEKVYGYIYCNLGDYTYSLSNLAKTPTTSSTSKDIADIASVTQITGVGWGFRIIFSNNSANITAAVQPGKVANYTVPDPGGPNANCPDKEAKCRKVEFTKTGRIEFVKTSNIPATFTLPSQHLSAVTFTSDVADHQLATINLDNAITVVPQTCTVTKTAVNVALTPASGLRTTTFTKLGSTSTPVNFSLTTNCSGIEAKVGLTITDPSNTSNTGDTLPLTNASTAKGLGVQILRNGSPINFGPDSSVAGNTNQIMLGSVNNTALTVPLTARYIQTATKVTPGTANAVATFTFSYQ